MSKPMRVVIVIGSPASPERLFRSGFGESSPRDALSRACRRDVDVSLLSLIPASEGQGITSAHALAPSRTPLIDRLLSTRFPQLLVGALGKSSVGRLLLSLGPADPSRVFWRSVRSDREAMAMLSSADVLLAADLPAVRTAWHLLHEGKVPEAYYGLQSAEKVFTARFGTGQPVR